MWACIKLTHLYRIAGPFSIREPLISKFIKKTTTVAHGHLLFFFFNLNENTFVWIYIKVPFSIYTRIHKHTCYSNRSTTGYQLYQCYLVLSTTVYSTPPKLIHVVHLGPNIFLSVIPKIGEDTILYVTMYINNNKNTYKFFLYMHSLRQDHSNLHFATWQYFSPCHPSLLKKWMYNAKLCLATNKSVENILRCLSATDCNIPMLIN